MFLLHTLLHIDIIFRKYIINVCYSYYTSCFLQNKQGLLRFVFLSWCFSTSDSVAIVVILQILHWRAAGVSHIPAFVPNCHLMRKSQKKIKCFHICIHDLCMFYRITVLPQFHLPSSIFFILFLTEVLIWCSAVIIRSLISPGDTRTPFWTPSVRSVGPCRSEPTMERPKCVPRRRRGARGAPQPNIDLRMPPGNGSVL